MVLKLFLCPCLTFPNVCSRVLKPVLQHLVEAGGGRAPCPGEDAVGEAVVRALALGEAHIPVRGAVVAMPDLGRRLSRDGRLSVGSDTGSCSGTSRSGRGATGLGSGAETSP